MKRNEERIMKRKVIDIIGTWIITIVILGLFLIPIAIIEAILTILS